MIPMLVSEVTAPAALRWMFGRPILYLLHTLRTHVLLLHKRSAMVMIVEVHTRLQDTRVLATLMDVISTHIAKVRL